MLINLKEALKFASKNNIALGSFNIYNIESLQAVLRGAESTTAPVICAFGESYDKHMPLEAMAELVKYYTKDLTQSFVLHLDHCKNKKTIERALKAGFTSVMFDASFKALSENINETKFIVDLAHNINASVEGELGYMNTEDGTDDKICKDYTTVVDAKNYTKKTNVDALAIAIGNAHGIYKGIPVLNFDRLQEINNAIDTPLVLHGSSGIPKNLLQKAITLGIRKININTEISTRGISAAREFLQKNTEANTRFETMTKYAENKMADVVENYLTWFTSAE